MMKISVRTRETNGQLNCKLDLAYKIVNMCNKERVSMAYAMIFSNAVSDTVKVSLLWEERTEGALWNLKM